MNGIKEKRDTTVRYTREYDDYDTYYNVRKSYDRQSEPAARFPKERRVTERYGAATPQRYGDDRYNLQEDGRGYDRYYGESRVRRGAYAPEEVRMSVSNYTPHSAQSVYEGKKQKRIGNKAKLAIVVFFAVVALITTMILINAIPSASAQSPAAERTPEVVISDGALNQGIGEDGKTNNVVAVPVTPENKYDMSTNWFDKFCDWIENLVG